MSDIPILKMHLEGMRLTMLQALASHTDEINQAVAEASAHFVKTFDLAGHVQRELEPAMAQQIRYAVADAVREAFKDQSVSALISKRVAAALRKGLRKP